MMCITYSIDSVEDFGNGCTEGYTSIEFSVGFGNGHLCAYGDKEGNGDGNGECGSYVDDGSGHIISKSTKLDNREHIFDCIIEYT